MASSAGGGGRGARDSGAEQAERSSRSEPDRGAARHRYARCARDSIAERGSAWLCTRATGRRLGRGARAPPAARALLELYAPICGVSARRPLTIAHLGQSLDGYIATGSGDSYYVTGPANVAHLHRLRALCDAVVVGAGTVASDDPQLTVRHVEGANPTRVILDPASARCRSSRLLARREVAPDLRRRRGGRPRRRAPPRSSKCRCATARSISPRCSRCCVHAGCMPCSSRWRRDGVELSRSRFARPRANRDRPARDGARPARTVSAGARPDRGVPASAAQMSSLMGGDVLFDCDLRASAPAPATARTISAT